MAKSIFYGHGGGPAYPVKVSGEVAAGMSKRDEFAKAAIPGLIGLLDPDGIPSDPIFDNLAENAYRIADAMLKARQK